MIVRPSYLRSSKKDYGNMGTVNFKEMINNFFS